MKLLAFIILAWSLEPASGHAYMYWPKSREAQRQERAPQDSKSYSPSAWAFVAHTQRGNHPYSYTVKSQFGIGPGHAENQPMQDPTDFSGFLCNKLEFWEEKGPVATYKEGGAIEIVIVQNAEHGGHHDFRLCPKKWSSLTTDTAKAECLDMYMLGCDSAKDCGTGPICKCGHQCTPTKECGCFKDGCKGTNPYRQRDDPIYKHGPPMQGSLVHGANVFNLTLPKGVTCDECTLQWVWQTTRNGEQFANCADIKIEEDPNADRRRRTATKPPVDNTRRRRRTTGGEGEKRRRATRRRRKTSTRRRKTSTRRRRRRKISTRRRIARRRESAVSASAGPGEYEGLGCFPKSEDDNDLMEEQTTPYQDTKCADPTRVDTSTTGPCRSGMPFYRFPVGAEPVQECFRFCTSKGMDLFGILGSEECRCGASQTNAAVWDWGKAWVAAQAGLTINSITSSGAADPSKCTGVSVYRNLGWLSAAKGEGLPERNKEDDDYVASIVKAWMTMA